MPARATSPDRGAPLRIAVHVADRLPAALRDRWHELAVDAENPFALPAWHEAWLATRPGATPFVLVCRDATGAVVGVVALTLERRRGMRRLLAPGGRLADWFGPACRPYDEARVAAAAAGALARMRRGWDVWELDRCRNASGWLDGLRDAARGADGLRLVPHRGDDVLVRVDLARGGPEPAAGKKRRELERLNRRLHEHHEVAVRRSATPQEAQRDFDALLRLRRAQWEQGFTAAEEAFQRAFAAATARAGLLRLWVVELDGAPAAALYGWRLGTRAFAYIQAFDRAHERFGIGMWLLAHAVRDAADEGCATFDMLRGDEGHKRHFHICRDAVESHRAVRRRSLGRLEAQALAGVRAGYRRLSPRGRERLRRALRM